ncbi:membrane protein [Bacteroidales bacterium]|nr:membrane protein [Bacteroidales bacterium]
MTFKIKLSIIFCIIFLQNSFSQDSIPIDKNVNYTAIPMLSFNLSKGFGVGFMAAAIYNLKKEDKVSPPSMTAMVGSYSTNKSWFGVVGQSLFLDQDNWRIEFALGHSNNNFQTFMSMPGMGDFEVPFNTKIDFVAAMGYRRVYQRLYLGANMQLANAKTEFDLSSIDSAANTKQNQNAFGFNAMLDTRNNIYNPSRGIHASITTYHYLNKSENANPYTKLNFYTNYYHSINKFNVLAARIFAKAAIGSKIPFEGLSVVGSKDLRGYSEGKYRDEQVYAIQAEDRWNFYKKFGLVGFAGLAITNSPKGSSSLLPAIGVGVRYKTIPSRNINVGIDVATGKDDWGLYFRIGEAF